MKIAQIAPLAESVPPKLYGGTERIVSYLTEELVRQGHDVTLFAPFGDVATYLCVADQLAGSVAYRFDDGVGEEKAAVLSDSPAFRLKATFLCR